MDKSEKQRRGCRGINGGDGNLIQNQLKVCFIVLMMTGACGGGTKGCSSHSLLLALSLDMRGTSLCARQAGGYLGRRRHTNTNDSSVKDVNLEYTAHICLLWTLEDPVEQVCQWEYDGIR